MWRTASRAVKNAPSRLTLITRRHSSADMSTKLDARLLTPALTNTESIRPSSATVSAMPETTASSSLTSHTIENTSTSYAAEAVDGGVVLVGVGAPDGDVGAVLGEAFRHPEADAAVAAGDQCDASGQVEG